MTTNIKVKILNTKNMYNYLKENSNWIKELSRNDNNYNKFVDYIKDKYSLKISDKVSSTIDKINFISNMLNAIK